MTDLDPTVAEEILPGLLYAARRGSCSPYEKASDACYVWRTLEAAGVPSRSIADALRPNLRSTPCVEAARRWGAETIRDPTNSTEKLVTRPRASGTLVLSGHVGIGKSVAAVVLVLMRVKAGLRAGAWFSCKGLADRPRWTRDDRSCGLESLEDLLLRVVRAPFVVFDDVGSEGARSPTADEWLSSVISQRHDHGLPTCITTNESPSGEELGRLLGPRLIDRIVDDGETIWDAGKSLRRIVKSNASPDEGLRASRRLVYLVDCLEHRPGHIGEIDVERVNAIAELGRLLSITQGDARRFAHQVAQERDREVALADEFFKKLRHLESQ